MTMERTVIFGAGGAATMSYYTLTYALSREVAAFTVDRDYLTEDVFLGLPVVAFDEVASSYPPEAHNMLVAVGYQRVNRIRAERCAQAKEMGYQLTGYIHPRAITWPGLKIGENCRVGADARIQPLAQIGDNVVIGSNSGVGHHVVVGDHCFISAGVSILGGVEIGPYCFIGGNATIRNRLRIGRGTVIGAGSVILEDTEENSVYLAQTAHKLSITSDQLPMS